MIALTPIVILVVGILLTIALMSWGLGLWGSAQRHDTQDPDSAE